MKRIDWKITVMRKSMERSLYFPLAQRMAQEPGFTYTYIANRETIMHSKLHRECFTVRPPDLFV